MRPLIAVLLALAQLHAADHTGVVKFGGLPVPGASVTATQGESKHSTITNPLGAYTFTNLKPWEPYRLSVTTVFVPSIPGYPVTRTVFLTAPTPSVPRSVSATAGTNKARVTWKAPAFVGNGPVTGYKVRKYLVTSSGSVLQQTVTLGSTASTYTFTGLTSGQSYRFSATAINASGNGVTSAKTVALTP